MVFVAYETYAGQQFLFDDRIHAVHSLFQMIQRIEDASDLEAAMSLSHYTFPSDSCQMPLV
ncbi:hypothetical protein HanIR_Chr15g0776801 [Helianthus annuus]|nr:hypothetical protein HanIR_Chr15g0776801 [Helianthus annuus]